MQDMMLMTTNTISSEPVTMVMQGIPANLSYAAFYQLRMPGKQAKRASQFLLRFLF